jgi:predicted flap endonuclease-1-like 5' DNA nuclease
MTKVNIDLPLSKLRDVPEGIRKMLKSRRITTCAQLLRQAGGHEERQALLRATGLVEAELLTVLHRADLARVDGLGAVFGMMIEDLGVDKLDLLAVQEPETLHRRVRDHNLEYRIARRSPTLDEVTRWVAQAQQLPRIIETVAPETSPQEAGMSGRRVAA